MIDEKILSFSATIFLIIFGLIILRLTTRITRTIEKPFQNRFGENPMQSKFFNREKNLERMVREQDPFNWRIGLALSVANLDPKSEQQFLKSLAKVLRFENSVIREKHEQKRRYLRQLIHPILPSKKFNEIVKFRDMFTVKRLMDGSTDRETLKYILQLSIDEYEAKKIPPQTFTRTITYLEADEDPFGPEAPF